MYPDYLWWGPMWFFPLVMPILMLVVLVLCLYFSFGRSGFRPPWHHTCQPYRHAGAGESALEIIRQRYARGEIDHQRRV
jgi:uncharacterized membrane protein